MELYILVFPYQKIMKYISHRGNLDGRNLKTENSPNQIDTVLSLGYDVEIDLRFLNNKFYLGHDDCQYIIDFNWLLNRKNKLWIHLNNSIIILIIYIV